MPDPWDAFHRRTGTRPPGNLSWDGEDPLAAPRGLVVGCLLCIGFYFALGVAVYLLRGCW